MKTHLFTPSMYSKIISISLVLLFGFFAHTMQAQSSERTVTGKVSSLDGPLLGATISLKGTTIAVASSEDGTFTFPKKLKENDVLVINYLGYKTAEVVIKGDTRYVTPFMEDIPVIIGTALRTDTPKASH